METGATRGLTRLSLKAITSTALLLEVLDTLACAWDRSLECIGIHAHSACNAATAIAVLYRICVTACHFTRDGIFSVSNGTTTVSPVRIAVLLLLNQREDSFGTTLPSALTT